MTDAANNDDLQALWQSQALAGPRISIEDIRDKSRHLEWHVSLRNLGEYVAAVLVVVSFGWMLWVEPSPISRVGAGLVVVGTIFIVHQLRRRGSAVPLPVDLAVRSALEFHCEQLAQQRDLIRGVWWWYLLPIVPGMLLVQIGQALAHPDRLSRIVVYCVVIVAGAAGVHHWNRRAAARIQQRIDRLRQSP